MPSIGRTALIACLVGTASIATAARAAEPFRIGIVTRDGDGARVIGLSAIEKAFRRALGRDVEVYVARDFAHLVEAHIDGRIDYAVYSTQAFAAAQLRCGCLRPVAAPVASDGSVGFRSTLHLRAETGSQAGVLRLAVGATDSLATRLMPLALSDAAKAARAGGSLVEAGTAGAAMAMYDRGEVDGYFGWEPVRPGVSSRPIDDVAQGDGVAGSGDAWRSDHIPFGPHAVRADFDDSLVGTMLSALNGASWETESAGSLLDPRSAGRFIAVSLDDYRPAIAAVALLGATQRDDE